MRPPNLSRPLFAAAIIVAGLVMASCAVPAAPDQPPSQPPITVVIVVTAVQPAEVTPTATSKPVVVEVTPTLTPTGKPPIVSPTSTSTGKPPIVSPTSTSTGKPPIVSPTSTSTSKPPIVSPTSTATSKPPTATVTRTSVPSPTRTRTVTPTPTRTATPPPHTRTLYSDKELVRFGFPPIVTGGKGETVVLSGRLLPPGCEIVDVKALDFHLPHEIQLPPVATARHMNTPLTGHGWTVARSSTNPGDLGVRVNWWYDAGNMLDMRLVYTVREPWDVDCNVPKLTQLEP